MSSSVDVMVAELKRYPGYKDSGMEWLGEVPAHWEVRRAKHVFRRIVGGSTPSSDDSRYWGNVHVWVTPADVSRSTRIRGSQRQLTQEGLLSCSAELMPAGSIVVTSRAPVGNVALAEVPFCTNQGCKVLVPNTDEIDSAFAFNLLHALQPELQSLAKGTTFTEVSGSTVGDVPLPLPPLPEQAAIVRFLDHADRRIRRYIRAKEELIALLEESRRVLINHAVSRGLDPNADTRTTRSHVFPTAPRDWTSRRMGSLVQRVRRPLGVHPDRQYQEIGIRSWGRGIFHKDPAPGAALGEKSVFRIDPGDFVLNIVFAWEGAVAVASEDEMGMIASHRFPTFRPSPDVDLDYLLMVFQSEPGRRLLEVNSPGAAGRNKTLRISRFLDEEIPLPTLDGQRAIVAAFREREQQLADCVAGTRQAVTRLEEYRACLIAGVVTGKLDVRGAAAGLPEVVPIGVEGEADDVQGDVGSERVGWRNGAEVAGAEPDVDDAERPGVAGELTAEER